MNNPLDKLAAVITENLRSTANLKNEVEKKEVEKHDQLKETALAIIDVLDSFEHIEEGFIEKGLDQNEFVFKTMNRYKTIQKKLLALLQKRGITKIDFPDNRLIIGLCEVVDRESDNSRQNDEVVTIIRNGYIRGKELIRAAQIIVVKN